MKKRPTIKNAFGIDDFDYKWKQNKRIIDNTIKQLNGLSVFESKLLLNQSLNLIERKSRIDDKIELKNSFSDEDDN